MRLDIITGKKRSDINLVEVYSTCRCTWDLEGFQLPHVVYKGATK